jgi:pyruvate carboxylase
VKVTPSSKVVGDMALFLVSHGMTMQEFEASAEERNLTIPNSVVEMFSGALGQPDGGWPKKLQRIVLRGAKPVRGRPGAHLKSIDFGLTAESLEKKIGRRPVHDEVLSFLMYPDVFLKFAQAQQRYGDVEVLPTPHFFYGVRSGEEIAVELEPGKTLILKFLTMSEVHPDGQRTVFFELNGQPREVTIRDKSQERTEAPKQMADPGDPSQVGAPTPGVITTVAVDLHQTIAKGDRLLVLEAMKMQSTIYAPVAGKVAQILVHAGQNVEAKELLIIIE